MSDPFEEMKQLAVDVPVHPLPAAEVRHRGERMRRRRHAFQAVGSALAVAVLAGGGLLVGDGPNGAGPRPAPATQLPDPSVSATAPPGGWATEIPEGFPLAVGLPAPEPEGGAPPWSTSDAADVAWAHLPCSDRNTGQSRFPSDADRTDASFIFAQTSQRSHVRHLTVYEDANSAAAAVEQILGQARACDAEDAIPGDTEFRWEVSSAGALGGEEAWLVSGGEYDADGSGREPARVLIALVREGNAVLVARLGDASAVADPADLTEPAAAEWAGHVTTMTRAMCAFAVRPCASPVDEATQSPRPADDAAVTRIPGGFDLTLGLPALDVDSKRTTSTDPTTSFVLDPCHHEGGVTGPPRTDFAQVVQVVPAGGYVRQLAVFASESAADVALTGMMRDVEACPTYTYPDDISEDRWTVLDSDPNRLRVDDALVAVNHAYTDGMRTTLATHHIAVRVGNAVLVVTLDGEFGAAPDDSGTTAVDREQRRVAADLIEQMCPFAGPDPRLDCG